MAIPDATLAFDLTEREIEILELLNEGLKNQEIADRTRLTLYTVKWYLKQIYSKLYVSNRTQAAAKARELGLFTEDIKRATRTMAAIRTNLPETVTPFFGREDELQLMKQLLTGEDVRLITLHGIGGMGKTRLALELGQKMLPIFSDGVYFIPLEATQTSPLRPLADALSLNSTSDADAQQVGTSLRDKHMLLIFDNFEHLLPHVKVINALLEYTNKLRIVVTSREVLNLRGEYVVTLSGLTSETDRAAYELYVQRAQLGSVNFNPNATERAYIHKICALVGGMPLAIEMAAGWSSVMTAEDTYQRLQHNIDLLTSDAQDRPERHQSIRATFDYSLHSLPDDLQQRVLKLGAFHTEGFSLKGAEAVADLSPLDIKQLVQVALLQRDMLGRFRFHPLIRQYITEILKSDKVLWKEAKESHATYYYAFSESLVEKLYGSDFSLGIINEFREDGGNLLLAWYYALSQGYYDWILVATEVGYITEMAGQWELSLKVFYDTLHAMPESEKLLRGRLLALVSIFEARLYNLHKMEATARESWELLKDSEYFWDGRAAMLYLAVLKTVMKDDENAFKVLNDVDSVPIPDQLLPNAYVDSLNRIGRPLTLLYAGRLQEALPLLEQAQVPTWAETVIYLPECYFLLGMEDKAHQLLVHLFTAALDNGNHRLAQMTAFYLALIENDDENIPTGLTHNLVELTRIGFKYEFIAQNGYYYGVTLMMRGLSQQAYYSWYGSLGVLDALGEQVLKYQYAYQIAEQLINLAPKVADELFMAMAHDPQCPDILREQARKRGIKLQVVAQAKPLTVYEVILRNANRT